MTLDGHGAGLRVISLGGQREFVGTWCLTHGPSAALPGHGRSVHAEYGLIRIRRDEDASCTAQRLHHEGGSVGNVDRCASLIVTLSEYHIVVLISQRDRRSCGIDRSALVADLSRPQIACSIQCRLVAQTGNG